MDVTEAKKEYIASQVHGAELFTIIGLQKALFCLGHSIHKDDLYCALKGSGWIKLRLIRDRLLDLKRDMPKRCPYDGVRNMIKYPLLVDRNEDLPEWKKFNGSNAQ